MSADRSESQAFQGHDGVYQALLVAEPSARAEQILVIVEAHPEGRLELPARGGLHATLDGINLGPERLRTHLEGAANHPPWWSAERQAVNLRRAELPGASLRHADLQHGLLEGANLAHADLAGANLQGADLAGANLEATLLEDADLRKAVLRFAQARGSVLEDAKLQGADLWGAALGGADLSGADLQGAVLEEADLEGADLAGADLRGAVLKRANLKNADLRGADLRGAALGGTNLEGAVLRDARVEELELTGCVLRHVHTCGARLERTRLDREQLGGAIGEELAAEYGLARKGYLALERNFEETGDHDAAGWAYRRRRRMEKWESLKRALGAWADGSWGTAAPLALRFAADQLVEWVCDYGESVGRVLATLLAVYLVFIPVYGVCGSVLRVEQTKVITRDPVDLALYSLTCMTSPGNPPDFLRPRNEMAYLLGGIQTILSIFLIGLMGFVAGNRIRR